jgi:integrase
MMSTRAVDLEGVPDIDLDAATLTVRHALQLVRGKRQLVEPKSDRSRRTLPLPEFAVKAPRADRTRQLQERLVAGSRWHESGHVFTTTVGTPMDERKVTASFHKGLSNAGLSRKRFHDLRHTAASLGNTQKLHEISERHTRGEPHSMRRI